MRQITLIITALVWPYSRLAWRCVKANRGTLRIFQPTRQKNSHAAAKSRIRPDPRRLSFPRHCESVGPSRHDVPGPCAGRWRALHWRVSCPTQPASLQQDQDQRGLLNHMDRIISMRRTEALQEANITHVVSALRLPLDQDLYAKYKHLVVEVDDDDDEDMVQHFATTNAFIREGLNGGGAVLVHWCACLSLPFGFLQTRPSALPSLLASSALRS